jgi:hypothetical protein
MSNKNNNQITVTVKTNSRKSKSIDHQISEFEQKLLDLLADPTARYLPRPEAFYRNMATYLQDVRSGLVVS